jgi:hypothetical protein
VSFQAARVGTAIEIGRAARYSRPPRAYERPIGVKNLKTAFTIGDEIRLMSAGQAIVQTLYANGRSGPPIQARLSCAPVLYRRGGLP